MEWPYEDSITAPSGRQYFASLGHVLQEFVYTLNQHPIHGTIPPIAKIHGSRNQGVETGVAPLLLQ